MKVYLYSTCLGQVSMNQMVLSAIELLQKCGAEVIYKKDQTCCGQPSYNTGYFEETKKIALYNMELFGDGDEPILIVSGSCAGMMMHDYVELFKGNLYEQKAIKFASRCMEISQFLDKHLQVVDKGEPIKVSWHSNCHALRVAKSIESNKNLIRKLANVELIELEREEECCGFGGTFSVKEPEISNEMALAKIADIEKTGVKYLISADGGCLLNINGTMKKNAKDIKCVHLYDFLLARLDGKNIDERSI
ncbi:(Fe-S)-binding protein [Campylobacter hyointestinalis]|uniref:(Fe-S)-binding protein n=1 Tax=Campylobacter hyointestinalis TaxID=198 RepID=A0A562XEN7_CAMHY|nr:(Fe-S)-binding protein [Campylobacter hyointestinalis]RAZ24237.1 (Fe-S)-binding protein [Campylobacter hyointestinalis subsp. lawsonii]RAZ38586.1 (Fe-S)-binding protein [Campylobacter hyointestinalis subsp. lawsonii]TWO20598.1 (Fe-S)-binding protein [Campylobacter hyointestinalis]